MQIADVNHQDFQPSAQSSLDEKLLVKFFIKQMPDKKASEVEGRPIFKDVEYIDIKIPGNRIGGATHPAQFRDRQRFPRHYAAFKERKSMPVEGTPLAEWPVISRTQVEELAFYNVKTVEQLVSMSDTNASKFLGMQALKRKAAKWLEDTDKTARINQIENLETSNKEKDERINSLETKLLDLITKVDDMSTNDVVTAAAKPKKSASKKAKA